MEFTHNGRHYVLRGLKAGKVQMVSPKKLPKALMVASQLCMLQLIPETVGQFYAVEATSVSALRVELQCLLQHYQDV